MKERLIILKVEEQASLKEIPCILGYFNIQGNEESAWRERRRFRRVLLLMANPL